MRGDYINERTIEEAKYIISTKATIRDTAKIFGVSKSTVFKDITERLPYINSTYASQVRQIIDFNKSELAVRGGRALAMIYRKMYQ